MPTSASVQQSNLSPIAGDCISQTVGFLGGKLGPTKCRFNDNVLSGTRAFARSINQYLARQIHATVFARTWYRRHQAGIHEPSRLVAVRRNDAVQLYFRPPLSGAPPGNVNCIPRTIYFAHPVTLRRPSSSSASPECIPVRRLRLT
jgi:hypothetical protein